MHRSLVSGSWAAAAAARRHGGGGRPGSVGRAITGRIRGMGQASHTSVGRTALTRERTATLDTAWRSHGSAGDNDPFRNE